MNNDGKQEKDSLSEILTKNKERRLREEENQASMDKTSVFREELFDSGKGESGNVPESLNAEHIDDNYDELDEAEENELHAIELDYGQAHIGQSLKASKRGTETA